MLTNDLLRSKFDAGLGYDDYVASGKPEHQTNWSAFAERVSLTPAQTELAKSFTREVNAIFVTGTWCGDCVQQLPLARAIEQANPEKVRLRFLDRDEHKDLAEQVKICGGLRVPVCITMNEDFDFISFIGDRTLTRYRSMAARQLGASCALPGAQVPEDEIAETLQDWVNDFERAHLVCRLSTKLRQRHGD